MPPDDLAQLGNGRVAIPAGEEAGVVNQHDMPVGGLAEQARQFAADRRVGGGPGRRTGAEMAVEPEEDGAAESGQQGGEHLRAVAKMQVYVRQVAEFADVLGVEGRGQLDGVNLGKSARRVKMALP